MPGDGHHALTAGSGGRSRAANPQSGSSSPAAPIPNAATVVMPGLWKKLQAPRDVGCGACGARRASQRALAACAACLAVVYCDRRCQAQHWERAHRHECGPLAAQSLEALVARIAGDVRAKRRHRAAVAGAVGPGVEDRDPAALLDAWLDEAGQQAAAASGATAAIANSGASPLWVDELRTLCLLANTCLLQNPAEATTAAAYLKALAIRGQLCLRPNTPKEKRRLAARNLAHARSMLGPALQGLSPVWQARVASVHARLLCALGEHAEREEALAVLRAAAAGMGEGGGAARALVLLELTQAGYYDRVGAGSATTAAAALEAEAACRAAVAELLLVVDGEKGDDGLCQAALLATGAFRLADLLLVRATTTTVTGQVVDAAAATEALALCRLSLRHAGPAQLAALESYMAHARALLGVGGRAEARAEVEGERRRRQLAAGGVDMKFASSSLLSLGGADAWRLPLRAAAGGAAAVAAVAGVTNCGAEFKGVGAPGTEHVPITTTLLGILTNHQQQPPLPTPQPPLATPSVVQEEKSGQPPKAPSAIPTTEEEQEREQAAMEVDRHGDDTMTSPSSSSSSYAPRSPVVAHVRSGDAGIAQPAAKRTRLSYYPFFQQQQQQLGGASHNKHRVTLPCWVGAK